MVDEIALLFIGCVIWEFGVNVLFSGSMIDGHFPSYLVPFMTIRPIYKMTSWRSFPLLNRAEYTGACEVISLSELSIYIYIYSIIP